MAQTRSGLLAEPELMEKTGPPLTPEGSKVLGAGTPVCGRPRPQPQSLLPRQEPKAYSSLACFSLQCKEDGRLSFSPGLEQGRIQFLYLSHFLAVYQKWVANPILEEAPTLKAPAAQLAGTSDSAWAQQTPGTVALQYQALGSHCSQAGVRALTSGRAHNTPNVLYQGLYLHESQQHCLQAVIGGSPAGKELSSLHCVSPLFQCRTMKGIPGKPNAGRLLTRVGISNGEAGIPSTRMLAISRQLGF